MRKKTFAILSLWTVTICWHLHYYATRAGSPIPSTFGVNQDWTRYHIIQTGNLGEIADPWTIFSGLSGTQNYDLGTLYLSIINIITDSTGLVEGLVLLNSLQFSSIVLLPIIFVTWYWFISNAVDDFNFGDAYLILLLSLFPSVRVIISGGLGWKTSQIAVFVLLSVFVLLPKTKYSKRHIILVVLLSFIMMNLYHTFVFLFLVLFTTSVGYYIISEPKLKTWDRLNSLLSLSILSTWVLFYITGVYLNNRLNELILSGLLIILIGIFDVRSASASVGSTVSPFHARDSELITTSTQHILFNLNIRRISKLIYNTTAFVIVVLFVCLIVYRYMKRNDIRGIRDRYERIIFGTLLSFPVFLIMFYGYGGLLTSIERTRTIGLYFSILIVGLLLRSDIKLIKYSTQIIVIIWITSAVIAAISAGLLTPIHTNPQEQAITHTGGHIADDSYVFSDPKMGMPLLYYDVRGISLITTKQPNWSESTRIIYFNESGDKSTEVESVIRRSQLGGGVPPPNDFYMLLSSYPKTEGVPLRSLVTKPTGIDPRNGFDSDTDVNKIYTNGEDTLFLSS